MLKSLVFLLERDLNRLYYEIGSYEQEESLWMVTKGITNSSGNLCLHLVGNLNHFIGHLLGKTTYVRDREYEFSAKHIKKEVLLKGIKETQLVVREALEGIDPKELSSLFPVQVFQEQYTIEQMLIHLTGHLNYHLGQINYHRRLLT